MFPTHLESTSPGGRAVPFGRFMAGRYDSFFVSSQMYSHPPPPTVTQKQKKVNSGGCTFASRLAFLVAQAS